MLSWRGAECKEMSLSHHLQYALGWCSEREYSPLTGLYLHLFEGLQNTTAWKTQQIWVQICVHCWRNTRGTSQNGLGGKRLQAWPLHSLYVSLVLTKSRLVVHTKKNLSLIHHFLFVLKWMIVDGIRLPPHKNLLFCFVVTQFCTKIVWILFSQDLPVAAGISKALGSFPAQMVCSSAVLQLPRSGEQWETRGSCGKASPQLRWWGMPWWQGEVAELIPHCCVLCLLMWVKELVVARLAASFCYFSIHPTFYE